MRITIEDAQGHEQDSGLRLSRAGVAIRAVRGGLVRVLEQAGALLEQKTWLAALLLCALYIPWVLLEAHAHLLSNDEIYTVHIAQAPTVRTLLAMSREIDLHPPLHYLLVRLSLHVTGPRWLLARLPSLLAGLIATGGLFALTRRPLGNLAGLVSVMLFWTGPVIVFAWSDRPYMLWICLLVLLALAWRSAARPGRTPVAVAAVFAASLLMISDHLFGIACLLPFWLAELVRARQRRRPDPALWLALTLPAVIGFGYSYQLHHLEQNHFPSVYVPSVGFAFGMYNALITESFFLVSVAVILGVYLQSLAAAPQGEEDRPLHLPAPEAALLGGLIALPILLMLVAAAHGMQFWDRYASCAVVGLAGLLPWMLYRRARRLRLLQTVLVLSFTCVILAQTVADSPVQGSGGRAFQQIGRTPLRLQALDPSLPIVDANAMTFTEMSDREPLPIAQRTYYLTSIPSALRYSGYTLFENEGKIRGILNLPSHAEDYTAFTRTHRRFYLVATYDRAEDWLPRALADAGADLDYLGKFASTYSDDDLYLVTLQPSR